MGAGPREGWGDGGGPWWRGRWYGKRVEVAAGQITPRLLTGGGRARERCIRVNYYYPGRKVSRGSCGPKRRRGRRWWRGGSVGGEELFNFILFFLREKKKIKLDTFRLSTWRIV